jgi:hypothetical protein
LLSPSLRGLRFARRPVGPTCLRELDASLGAPEPHDFAVRFTAVRLRALRSLTGSTPALPSPRARGRCRVHRIPFPTSVTIAKRPSVGQDGFGYASDLGQAGNEIFLQMGLDKPFLTTRSDLPVGQFCKRRKGLFRRDGGDEESAGDRRGHSPHMVPEGPVL